MSESTNEQKVKTYQKGTFGSGKSCEVLSDIFNEVNKNPSKKLVWCRKQSKIIHRWNKQTIDILHIFKLASLLVSVKEVKTPIKEALTLMYDRECRKLDDISKTYSEQSDLVHKSTTYSRNILHVQLRKTLEAIDQL